MYILCRREQVGVMGRSGAWMTVKVIGGETEPLKATLFLLLHSQMRANSQVNHRIAPNLESCNACKKVVCCRCYVE